MTSISEVVHKLDTISIFEQKAKRMKRHMKRDEKLLFYQSFTQIPSLSSLFLLCSVKCDLDIYQSQKRNPSTRQHEVSDEADWNGE